MTPLYIFDLDGTLANITHRRHIIESPGRDDSKWRDFYASCSEDKPNISVCRTLINLFDSGSDIWIWTGRSSEVRAKTHNWLDSVFDFAFMEFEVKMRDVGDHTYDHILKKKWLDEMSPEDRARLVAVFEDRSRVVRMWRDAGITCFHVADGKF